ncbi:MAG: hypothetical protein JW936_03850 [Sedimentisphaerales bacterium]|nr:hypothetical protein [Sedimentisphaerales bacterium]
MAKTLNLKRFSNLAVLKQIEFGLLLRFLRPYSDHLAQRNLPLCSNQDEFDYDELAKILMSPRTDTPEEMLDALYFVDALLGLDVYDRLLEEATRVGAEVAGSQIAPADLTIIVWLEDREILERIHAEQFRTKQRKFESYFCSGPQIPPMPAVSDVLQAGLENDLNEWFDTKKKGRGTKVFPFVKEDEVWFLIRHGQRIKREGTIKSDGEANSIFYRPEKFDVLIYYANKGELALHADTMGEKQAYCRYIGRHLFGNDNYFRMDDPVAKYTLDPLIEQGRGALICSDVDGIEHIRLVELYIEHKSGQKDIEIRRADDAFTVLENLKRSLSEEANSTTLTKAKFKVLFEGTEKERIVDITPPNIASFEHDSDSEFVYAWLASRGFLVQDRQRESMDEPQVVLTTAGEPG